MNPFRIAQSVARVFYYEGINGLLVRVKARLQRQSAISPSDIQVNDEAIRANDEAIHAHLTHTKMVVLEDVWNIDDFETNINGKERSLLMVIPPPEHGSGGRMTMARILRNLAASNVRCYVTFYPEVPEHLFSICEHAWMDEFKFTTDECSVLTFNEAIKRPYDIAIATFWPSTYIVRHQIRAKSKGYLVQDFEPYFYPPGSNYAFAEESYRLGLWGICASPWLAEKLSNEYDMKTAGFMLGIEKHEYHLMQEVPRDNRLVIAYVRQHTERRGFELVMWALKKIKDEMPDVRIEIFGDARLPLGEFLWIDKNHGILDHDQLCQLYNKASVGIVTSFTNYSLIPNEMIACGCAVVDLDTDCTRSVFPPDVISFASATPLGIAEAVKTLVMEPAIREYQVSKGHAYVANLSWDKSLTEIQKAIMHFSSDTIFPPETETVG